jgi:serine/threonine protein kinase
MIGQHVQNYLVTTHLGEGGMGTVFKATDEVLGREVALKMLHTPLVNQSQFLERFKKEARILAKLLHPNIAVIYNFIEHHNRHFMVMEYVEGYNLDQLLRQKQILSYKLIVPILLQALEGLHHAHKKDICHRDIKPSNLILTPDGTVKLMDFGIAKIAGEQRLTQVARVVGTLEYMAPELIEGKDASVATDIYALGITAYELLTGKLPFSGSTDFNVMQDILKKAPLSPGKLDAGIPKGLCDIIMKALQKKPAERFATAKEFQGVLASAFPGITTVDVASLKQEAPETRFIETAGATRVEMANTILYGLDILPKGPAGILTSVRRRMLAYSPAQLFLVASVLVAFVVVAISISSSRKPVPILVKKEQSVPAKTQLPALARQGITEEVVVIPTRTVSIAPVTTDEDGISNHPEEKKQLTPVSKRKTAPRTDPDKTPAAKTILQTEVEKTGDAAESVVSAKKEKYIYINSKLKVVLQLAGVVDSDNARAGQLLHFTVLKPVIHEGETIIAAGASAEGKITVMNNRKLVLVLTSVQAVNGQKILFDEDELGGRPDKVLSRKHFTGVIRKGLSLIL